MPSTLKQIEVAKKSGKKSLLLSYCEPAPLPDSLWDLVDLEWLMISGNKISHIPSKIGKLVNLKDLTICDNGITTLPKEIGDLEKLEYLSLHYTHKTIFEIAFPPYFYGLKYPIEINNIISLPKEIGRLSNLINFSCFPIQSPDNITTFNGKNRCFIRLDCGDFVLDWFRGDSEGLVREVKKLYDMDIQDWCPEVVKFL